ncbi:shematrin-like protein 1 [Drosophila serrata]|uniref:shematrin-like protein 1 n=1 Tax=Drosophila serrata TaxID=7274 RepID=UPI000A1CF509|nr:shematrin-like protein 1 [Drosophila serrata]
MYLPARLSLLSLLLSTVALGQKSKSREDRPQSRTLGLLTPLLLGGGAGPLFDYPVAAPIRPAGGSSSAGAGGAGAQSDPLDSYYGSSYPSYGYRPNYGYGYPNYGYNYGYPGYGYGYNPYRPSYNYNYGGYQRPQPYYGYRPSYSAASVSSYPGYGSTASISSSPSYATTTSGLGVGSGVGAGAGAGVGGAGNQQLSQAQAAQLAGLLGQALGSSLRPLLANGGAGAASGSPGVGANPQALSGLLGLLG